MSTVGRFLNALAQFIHFFAGTVERIKGCKVIFLRILFVKVVIEQDHVRLVLTVKSLFHIGLVYLDFYLMWFFEFINRFRTAWRAYCFVLFLVFQTVICTNQTFNIHLEL